MGIRLTLMEWWTPSSILNHELENLRDRTTIALKSLLAAYVPNWINETTTEKPLQAVSLKEKRVSMAKEHTVLVETLMKALGPEKAVQLGREAMFQVGKELGDETRRRLGVGDKPEDVVKAAKVLYRVLGIEFEVVWHNVADATLFVNRCALAKDYSEVTCLVLSATDEGVVKGLNPKMSMSFKDRLTCGCTKCTANITVKSN